MWIYPFLPFYLKAHPVEFVSAGGRIGSPTGPPETQASNSTTHHASGFMVLEGPSSVLSPGSSTTPPYFTAKDKVQEQVSTWERKDTSVQEWTPSALFKYWLSLAQVSRSSVSVNRHVDSTLPGVSVGETEWNEQKLKAPQSFSRVCYHYQAHFFWIGFRIPPGVFWSKSRHCLKPCCGGKPDFCHSWTSNNLFILWAVNTAVTTTHTLPLYTHPQRVMHKVHVEFKSTLKLNKQEKQLKNRGGGGYRSVNFEWKIQAFVGSIPGN